ncbi:MAG: hypothetical protein SVR94_10020 [Pseudomonadota bacterium]|nr:hypothetical protein [Pseudomonadota bacterium]
MTNEFHNTRFSSWKKLEKIFYAQGLYQKILFYKIANVIVTLFLGRCLDVDEENNVCCVEGIYYNSVQR